MNASAYEQFLIIKLLLQLAEGFNSFGYSLVRNIKNSGITIKKSELKKSKYNQSCQFSKQCNTLHLQTTTINTVRQFFLFLFCFCREII